MVELDKCQREFIAWFNSKGHGMHLLTGHAGAGKTTVMGCLKGEITFCAPTHRAADVLASKVHAEVMTVSAALGLRMATVKGSTIEVPTGKHKLYGKKIIVIDEASMVSEYYIDLLVKFTDIDAKILFVGDPAQLPPVGLESSPVFDRIKSKFHLEGNHRQEEGSSILAVANVVRNGGSGYQACKDNGIQMIKMSEREVADFYREYPDGVALCPTNRQKDFCNFIARKVFSFSDSHLTAMFLPTEKLRLETPLNGLDAPRNGDIVTIVCTDGRVSFLGFYLHGMTVADEPGHHYQIMVASGSERKKVEKHLRALKSEYYRADIERKEVINSEVEAIASKITFAAHKYAMTVHKSQGSTIETVLLSVSGLTIPVFARQKKQMVYTGITRASKTLIVGEG